MQIRRFVLLAASSLAALACGGSDTSPGEPTPPAIIPNEAEVFGDPGIFFSPSTVFIKQGGTVTIDFGSVAHNAFFDNQPAGAPANITGENANVSKTLTFTTAGTFVFNCHIHPGMQGKVIVVAPTAPAA